MAIHHEKMTKKPKKAKVNGETQHFENVARTVLKVPKSETSK
jgi:hypothetical protein